MMSSDFYTLSRPNKNCSFKFILKVMDPGIAPVNYYLYTMAVLYNTDVRVNMRLRSDLMVNMASHHGAIGCWNTCRCDRGRNLYSFHKHLILSSVFPQKF